MPDALVVGSGPNGLVAANLLADEGWSVTVLEATDAPGGAVRSAELIEPDYVNDVCSAFYPLAAASPTISALDLERHGLRWRHAPTVLAHPTLDGTCPVLSRDVNATAASFDRYHPGDGDAWRRLMDGWENVREPLLGLLLNPFPPVRPVARLAAAVGPADLVRFARFMLLPVRRLGEEEFDSDQARRIVAGAALHADLSPELTLSGMYGWLLCGLGHSYGWPVPEGGAGRLVEAMTDRLAARGGTVVCDARVDEVVVRDGRAVAARLVDGTVIDAGRAVLADVNAPMLYTRLVAAGHLPDRLLDDVRRFHWDDATVKVDWTLDGPIPWTAPEARSAGTVHIAEGVDGLTAAAAELARGLVPEKPFLLLGQQSMTDPTRQPAGKETAWAYTHVPRRVRGDAASAGITGDWGESDRAAIVERIEASLEALAPGFRALIRGRHVLTPTGLEAVNPNLDGGAINGGTAQLHQQLVFRPVPGLGRPETPIAGLYLASGSAHPGGGVHGAAGANAARAAVLGDRRRRARALVGWLPPGGLSGRRRRELPVR